MKRSAASAVLAMSVLVLTACGPSAEETAALEAADAAACERAMTAYDEVAKLIADGTDSDDFAPAVAFAAVLTEAAEEAGTEGIQEVLADAGDGLQKWVDRAMQFDAEGKIPLYVDHPMWLVEVNCSEDD